MATIDTLRSIKKSDLAKMTEAAIDALVGTIIPIERSLMAARRESIAYSDPASFTDNDQADLDHLGSLRIRAALYIGTRRVSLRREGASS